MKRVTYVLLLTIVLLSACSGGITAKDSTATPPAATPNPETLGKADCYTQDMSVPINQRVEKLLSCMTLAEKIGQMTQVEKNSLKAGDITKYFIGSVLSGGGGSPTGDNTPAGWAKMINGFQDEALATRLGVAESPQLHELTEETLNSLRKIGLLESA